MIERNNKLRMKSVSSLMDGRYFYIPSYQRGYRWDKEQVEALLDDLYEFATENHGKNTFYCLQPVVVKQVTDEKILQKLRISFEDDEITGQIENETSLDNETETVGATSLVLNHRVWEVIDGQQRLTTIYILYNYLMELLGYDANWLSKMMCKKSYSLEYETRPGSAKFINNLSKSNTQPKDIDSYFMLSAHNTIKKWFLNNAPTKYNVRPYDLSTELWALFDDNRNAPNLSVKFIWFEIDASAPDSIDIFQHLNSGQISLTDAELIKALFLQNRDGKSADRIAQIALEWESIENTLSKDNFWTFLADKINDKSSRMEFLLNLYAKIDSGEKGIDESRHHYLFNYYYTIFSSFSKGNIIDDIQQLWNRILDVFRTLSDWYEDPELYNFVGYLSQNKVPFFNIFRTYSDSKVESKSDFIQRLKEMIKITLRNCKTDDDNKMILNKYNDPVVRSCLLLLNIDYLNSQLVSLRQNQSEVDNNDYMSPAFKFPFDLYLSQHWNVEHIDSATTNAMKDKETQLKWIETAMADLNLQNDNTCKALKEQKKYDDLIFHLKELAKEEDDDDKMEIGNLTLLDEATNKGYGNSLFVTKRKIIFENILRGSFIPACTQLVFAKTFEVSKESRTMWTNSDKESYTHFIYDRISKYLR